MNACGVIDADYADNPDNEGHIQIMLYNAGKVSQPINKGDRIAQGIFTRYFTDENDVVETERVGGFGSTGETKYPIQKNKKAKEWQLWANTFRTNIWTPARLTIRFALIANRESKLE